MCCPAGEGAPAGGSGGGRYGIWHGGEAGENEKLVCQVLGRGLPPEVAVDTPLRELVDLGLRYDLTVPLTRFYGNNHASLPMPFRSLQVGPGWRGGGAHR